MQSQLQHRLSMQTHFIAHHTCFRPESGAKNFCECSHCTFYASLKLGCPPAFTFFWVPGWQQYSSSVHLTQQLLVWQNLSKDK
jgi:hypothetical protein